MRGGDLGWSLDYATAWCYKHLVSSRTDVVDAIDRVRELPGVEPWTPFLVFDHLDRSLFGKKLDGMVYLRWRSSASSSPGTTSAAEIVRGVGRVCIELNRTPFEDEEGDVDYLLDVLIHQMIHAYFLVACGPQPKGATRDGRLMDGLHFGVVLFTIDDITKDCQDGRLDLIFYAADRINVLGSRSRWYPGSAGMSNALVRPGRARRYIALDPRGSAIGPAPADGQSHCSHDNRRIRRAQIRNWQVGEYARAIDLDLEAKGNTIYELDSSNRLVRLDRMRGPPSASYIELIWDGKRVMVPRTKALSFAGIKKPIQKNEKYELKIPECSIYVFRLIHDFIQHQRFHRFQRHFEDDLTDVSSLTDGTLPYGLHLEEPTGLLNQIKTFKTAGSLKFEELQRYILKFLHDTPGSTGDPIAMLRELYNEDDKEVPIHAELHRWARAFLGQSYHGGSGWYTYSPQAFRHGTSNYETLFLQYPEEMYQLYYTNLAFKDDCKIVEAEMAWLGGGGIAGLDVEDWQSPFASPRPYEQVDELVHRRKRLSRRASDYRLGDLGLGRAPRLSLPSLGRSMTLEDLTLPSVAACPMLEYPRPHASLALPSSEVSYKYYGRDGRLKTKNMLTGEKFIRRPSPFAYERGTYSY